MIKGKKKKSESFILKLSLLEIDHVNLLFSMELFSLNFTKTKIYAIKMIRISFHLKEINSTSKIKVEFGGMIPPIPCEP